MCGEEDVTFVDNTPSFHLKDDSINDACLEDGTHLTFKATNKLTWNLQLNMKDGINNVCETRQPKRLDTAKKTEPPHKTWNSNIEETNEDFSHPFWTCSHNKVLSSQTQKTLKKSVTSLENYHKESRDRNYRNYSNRYETRCYFCYEANQTKKTCRH